MSTRTNRSGGRARLRRHLLTSACEPLERRALLSLAVAGPEFRVNANTAGSQAAAAVAADADGDFVVAWEDDDGGLHGIFAQRFSRAGVALGGEFRVNTFTTGSQL